MALVFALPSSQAWAIAGIGTTVETNLTAAHGPDSGSAVATESDNPNRVLVGSATPGGPPKLFVSGDGLSAGSGVAVTPPPAAKSLSGSVSLALAGLPSLAGDADGNFWVAVASSGLGSGIYVNRMPAGSSSLLAEGVALPSGSSDRQELPSIAVNDWNNGNPNDGKIYVTWVERNGGTRRVVVSECVAGPYSSGCTDPANWTPGNALAAAAAPGGLYLHPEIATAPNGDVYVIWWDAGPDNAVEINRCQAGEDCSQSSSWDEAATLAKLDKMDDNGDGVGDPLPISCPIIAAPNGGVNPSPAVEVDPGGYVFATYSDLRNNPDPASPTRCSARGSDKTWDSYLAAGPAPGVIPALDSGVRVSPDPSASGIDDHFLPALAIDHSDGRVDVSFTTTFGDQGGQTTVRRVASTTNRAATISDSGEISNFRSRFSGPNSDGSDYGVRQGADSAGGVLRAAWTDNRSLQSRDADLYVLANQAETMITAGPAGTVATAINSFAVASPAPRIECSLDEGRYQSCAAGLETAPLPNGPHRVRAQATDAVGNPVDLSPAIQEWSISDLTAPETAIILAPRPETKKRRPFFVFDSTELGSTWECRYDEGEWLSCPRGHKRAAVKLGRHRFKVRAIDVGGNIDRTPAKYKFRRLKPKPKPKPEPGI